MYHGWLRGGHVLIENFAKWSGWKCKWEWYPWGGLSCMLHSLCCVKVHVQYWKFGGMFQLVNKGELARHDNTWFGHELYIYIEFLS